VTLGRPNRVTLKGVANNPGYAEGA
jgi:hypothetical protein